MSISLEADFCVEALREAIARHGHPEIFNTDQGVQFTSAGFLDELESRGIRVSMDGKGRFLADIFIERLWRSLKYEDVFIKSLWLGCGGAPRHRLLAAFITKSGCTRRWATGRRVRFSMAKRTSQWRTPPL
jgi:transposase InsO family protein